MASEEVPPKPHPKVMFTQLFSFDRKSRNLLEITSTPDRRIHATEI